MIILASTGKFIIHNDLEPYLGKPLSEFRILYITTAYQESSVARQEVVMKKRQRMSELWIKYTDYDIAGKTSVQVEEMVNKYEIVYVEWWNTFYLLKCIRESGFEYAIKKALRRWLIYIWVSAWAYVATPSIVITSRSERPLDRFGIDLYDAMSLVPFYVKPHLTDASIKDIAKKVDVLDAPVRALNDNQALIIDNNMLQLIGQWNQIVMNYDEI